MPRLKLNRIAFARNANLRLFVHRWTIIRLWVALSVVFTSFGIRCAAQDGKLVPISPVEEQGRHEGVIGFTNLGQFQEEELPLPQDSDAAATTLKPPVAVDRSNVEPNTGLGEAIRQRYPDGKVQILRYVKQDESGNYFNEGPWKLFNRSGQVLAEGEFRQGLMDGNWTRWHPANSEGIFRIQPLTNNQGPYLSVASFINGKLNGTWTIYDRSRRKVFEMNYTDGLRQGPASWWNSNGELVREVSFHQGVIHGQVVEYSGDRQPSKQSDYDAGRRVYSDVTWHREGQKKNEDFYLDAKMELQGEDNWWDAEPAQYVKVGEPERHGATRAWFENGQPRLEGQFSHGARHGTFTWWYANGQKQLSGDFRQDKKSGVWTWWHANGMKAVQGNYTDDAAVGTWSFWDENGRIIQSGQLGESTPATTPTIMPDEVPQEPPLTIPGVESFEEITPQLRAPDEANDATNGG